MFVGNPRKSPPCVACKWFNKSTTMSTASESTNQKPGIHLEMRAVPFTRGDQNTNNILYLFSVMSLLKCLQLVFDANMQREIFKIKLKIAYTYFKIRRSTFLRELYHISISTKLNVLIYDGHTLWHPFLLAVKYEIAQFTFKTHSRVEHNSGFGFRLQQHILWCRDFDAIFLWQIYYTVVLSVYGRPLCGSVWMNKLLKDY